jgi:hypothetical protein
MGAALCAWLTGWIVEQHLIAQETLLGRALTDGEKLTTSLVGYQSVFVTYACVYVVAAVCWCFVNVKQPFDHSENST